MSYSECLRKIATSDPWHHSILAAVDTEGTDMFEGVRKWFAVRSYAKSLGPKLKERYGAQKHYTPAQVKRTAEEGGYNIDYLCMALCMYCTHSDFTDYHQSIGEICDYSAMRAEIADRFFGGDASFDAGEVIHGGSGWDSVDSAGNPGDASDGCSNGNSGSSDSD